MPGRAVALSRDQILRSLASYTGVTTANGNVGGTTLFDNVLIGSNDFLTGKTVILESGLNIFEDSAITVFNPATGQLTVSPAFSSQVLVGTTLFVLNEASAKAVLVLLNAIYASVGPGTQGLCYKGTVTAVPGVNQFTIPTLAGLGAGKFIDLSGVAPYYAFVFRDTAGGGAAPQNESRAVTGYADLTGNFSANAFTVPVGIGDEMLIMHPFLARIMNLRGLPPITGTQTQNWQAAETNLVIFGAANTPNKVHQLVIGIQNTVGNISIRMYELVTGVERRFYPIPAGTTFNALADSPAIPVINGTIGIHEAIRVTIQSDNVADNGVAIDYDLLMEAM